MRVLARLAHALQREAGISGAQLKHRAAQIDGVRAEANGGAERVHTARRREQFNFVRIHLHIKAEQRHVAVLHYVILALGAD